MTESAPRTHRPGPDAVPTPGAAPELGSETSQRKHEEELVDEAIDESFPASDPPSYSPTDTSGSDSGNRAASQDLGKPRPPERRTGPGTATADQLRDAVDRGATGDKVPAHDPAAAPFGTDEEAAGTPLHAAELSEALEREKSRAAAHGLGSGGQSAAGQAAGHAAPHAAPPPEPQAGYQAGPLPGQGASRPDGSPGLMRRLWQALGGS